MNEKAKAPRWLGEFWNPKSAWRFSDRTDKPSAVVLGDDGRYWVVDMATFVRLLRAGYQAVPRHT